MRIATSLAVLLAVVPLVGCDEEWGPWTQAVNLGAPVNSALTDTHGVVSKDGKSLFFTSGSARGAGGFGMLDIWVSQRASVDAPWGEPQNLGPVVNSAGRDICATLSLDEHKLYFASNRPGSLDFDLYVCHRQNKQDDFGWEAPVRLGDEINSPASEESPIVFFEDEETDQIFAYFASDRRNPDPLVRDFDIYQTTLLEDGTFGPVTLVEELSVLTHRDRDPAIRRDGREFFFATNRPGGFGGLDLWTSTRAHTSDPWGAPVHLGTVNSPTRPVGEQSNDQSPFLSRDGTTLFFASAFREGNNGQMFDVWVSTRTKVKKVNND